MSPTFPPEVIGARSPSLKIAARRDKDLADCVILLSNMKIRTREQAQQIVERYLLPGGLQKDAENIEHALRWLFEGNRYARQKEISQYGA